VASKIKRTPFDIESGGLELEHSLLTFYMCVLDDNGTIIDELDMKLKPDDGKYNLTAEAMKVNGININEHDADPETVTYSEGKKLLLEFTAKNSVGKRTLRPAGHNIGDFDIPMTRHHLGISKEEWNNIFHYRLLDTSPVLTIMQDAGWLPEELGSQDSLVAYYGVTKRKSHVAKNDTLMWVDVYLAMLKSLSDRKNGSSSSDELLMLE
jgi:DNA polymerase III epsilon subunit-like protein